MKSLPHYSAANRGFVLVEFMVTSMATLLVVGLIYYLLNAGMVLFAKNTAVNVAHQQARVAVLTMEQDLHTAISIPQLVDADGVSVGGVGPAAGISFQKFVGGPYKIEERALAGQNQIKVSNMDPAKPAPKVGQRLNLPLHQIELEITSVGAGMTTRILTLASNLPRTVEVTFDGETSPSNPTWVTGFISEKYSYVVKGGALRYIRPGDTAGKVLANDITSAAPFSIPATPLGAAYNRFVAAINLSTADHTSSNRKFKSANMFLNSMVPYRAKLCYYQ